LENNPEKNKKLKEEIANKIKQRYKEKMKSEKGE
jgi:hypothetical protein